MKLSYILHGILALVLLLTACKQDTPQNHDSKSQDPSIQQQAENIIQQDPYVEIVSIEGDKIHIRNKHTKRALIIPFQMVIDQQYEMIREHGIIAEQILQNLEAQKKLTQKQVLPKVEGWGKTPAWIPRYPGLHLSSIKLHTTRDDGSIWGNISGTHSESKDKAQERLIEDFKKFDMELTGKRERHGKVHMIFDNNHTIQNDSQELRKVNCTISRVQDITTVSFQYMYGM